MCSEYSRLKDNVSFSAQEKKIDRISNNQYINIVYRM